MGNFNINLSFSWGKQDEAPYIHESVSQNEREGEVFVDEEVRSRPVGFRRNED